MIIVIIIKCTSVSNLPMSKSSFILNVIILSIFTSNAYAQPGDEPSPMMETMVVTAKGFEQVITQAAASISVISREDIEMRAYKDITDALKDVPGVNITGGGDAQDISIRNMPAGYTVILVDGKKQSGREGQQLGGNQYEQNWLPPLAAIERIEVVRGPMSTLYGSDAIGGVINIITRKNYSDWHGNVRAEATLQESSDSGNAYQGQVYLAGPLIENLLSMNFTGMYQQRVEDNIENGYPERELDNYQGAIHLTPTDSDSLSLSYNKQDQQITSTEGKTAQESANSDTSSFKHTKRDTVSLTHSGDYASTSGESYIQREKIDNITSEMEVINLTANTQWAFDVWDTSLVAGVAYTSEELTDLSRKNIGITNASNNQWSVFSEGEHYLTDDFILTLGLRVDDNEQFDTHLSPRIYGVWNAIDNWTIKTGISTGYTAPTLRAMTEGWVSSSGGGNIYGNPDLKPETSVTKEIGVYYQGESSLQSSATVFHNSFKDKIVYDICTTERCEQDSSRNDPRHNVNVNEAETYGFELTAKYDLSDNFNVNSSYTYTRSKVLSGNGEDKPLTKTPLYLLALSTNWKPVDSINTWLRYNLRGRESQPSINSNGEAKSQLSAPSIGYTDIGVNYSLTSDIKLMAAIYNLFDEQANNEEFGYIEDGRRYWLGINASF